MKIYELLQNKKSQALIIAIIFIAIVLVLGTGLLFHARSNKGITDLQTKTNKAYSLAKSGLELAASQIGAGGGGSSGSCRGGGGSSSGNITETTYTLGSGQITIKATDGAITSTGKFADSWQVLTKTVPVPQGGTPVATWIKVYGGAAEDNLRSVRQTADGKYMLGGHTLSWGAGNNDAALIKLDADGNIDSTFGTTGARTYGGTFSEETVSSKISQTPDGGYVLGVESESFKSGGSGFDLLVVKTNASGGVAWSHIYRTPKADQLQGISPTFNNSGVHDGYIFGGKTTVVGKNFLVVRTDPNGTPLASFGTNGARFYTPTLSADGRDILQVYNNTGTPDGFIIGGYCNNLAIDFQLIKTDDAGTVTWANAYGASGNDYLYAMQQTSDRGYILGGFSNSFSAKYVFLVVKTGINGTLDWAKSYANNDATTADYIFSVTQTSDGGYIMGGYSIYGADNYDILVIKVDSSGNIQWSKLYGNTSSTQSIDTLRHITQTNDGGYVLLGRTTSWGAGGYDNLVIKIDAFGELCCVGTNISRLASVTPTTRTSSITVTPFTVAVDATTGLNSGEAAVTVTTSNPNPNKVDKCY